MRIDHREEGGGSGRARDPRPAGDGARDGRSSGAGPSRRAPGGPADPDQRLLSECDVEFFVASGPGGQHRNRTETGVRLRHRPTGIVVTATERRSQRRNREAALERLKEKLAARRRRRKKRVATRPSRAARRRRLEAKRRTSEKKAGRARPRRDE